MVLENSSTFLSTQVLIAGLILSLTPGQPLGFVSPNLKGWFELSDMHPLSYTSARPSSVGKTTVTSKTHPDPNPGPWL